MLVYIHTAHIKHICTAPLTTYVYNNVSHKFSYLCTAQDDVGSQMAKELFKELLKELRTEFAAARFQLAEEVEVSTVSICCVSSAD